MTFEEIDGCFRLLRAYWPGEWDEARHAVWGEAFADLSHNEAQQAIMAMGRNEQFCSVATFLNYVKADIGPDPRGTFLMGTGWVKEMVRSPRQVGPAAEARARIAWKSEPDAS